MSYVYLTKSEAKNVVSLLYSMYETFSGGYELDNFVKDYIEKPKENRDFQDDECYERAVMIRNIKETLEKKTNPNTSLKIEVKDLKHKLKEQRELHKQTLASIAKLQKENCELKKQIDKIKSIISS